MVFFFFLTSLIINDQFISQIGQPTIFQKKTDRHPKSNHLTKTVLHFFLLEKMKQLDDDVSPPAFVWNPYLGLVNLTFEWCLRYELLSSNFCPGIFVQSQTDRRKATPKSQPCISTGGLKNQLGVLEF